MTESHRLLWMAAGLRRAARSQGVSLPIPYSLAVAEDGLALSDYLRVSRTGAGVIIHTVPRRNHSRPVLLGYADSSGQWRRDRQLQAAPVPSNRVRGWR